MLESCNCVIIENIESLKYPSQHIDYKPKYNYHIKHVEKVLRKYLYIFKVLGFYLNFKLFKIIYILFVQSTTT